MGDEQQELTFGGKAVGLTFNPSGDERVTEVKKLFANIIDLLAGPSGELLGKSDETGLAGRLRGVAVDDAIVAQMLAVKVITWKD